MKAGKTIILLLTSCVLGCCIADAQTASGVVNAYYKVTTVNTAANTLTVDNAAGLTPGQRVLVIQSKGAAITSANSATFGDITAIASAGNYEFNTICSITANNVVLKATLLHTYDPAGAVQLVSIPSYGSVIISGTVNAIPWDPATGKGGIVVIEASGTIYLNADIDVSGQGLLGAALVNYPTPSPYNCDWYVTVNNYFLPFPASGDYTGGKKGEGITDYITGKEYGMGKLANGGGGGNNSNTGGAGGGNYGLGGNGGQRSGEGTFYCHGAYPGIGGSSLAAYGYSSGNNRIFFGGGGGSGHENNARGEPGGNGGGIIILSAASIVGGGGRLLASGLVPVAPVTTPPYADPYQAEGDGGGGGGAGGTIILNAAAITGSVIAEAKGARGSDASNNNVGDCTGPGGGGGGGAIWAAGAGFPAAVTPSVTGGANGVVSAGNNKPSCTGASNGALPGGAGNSLASYTAPESTTNTCIALASTILKDFTGYPEDGGYHLSWTLYNLQDASTIRSYIIERSTDRVHFTTLSMIAGSPDSINYQYTDHSPVTGTVYYRLAWQDQQGERSWSRILTRSRPIDPGPDWFRIHPNPVPDQLSVQLFSAGEETVSIRIFTAQGQPLRTYSSTLHTGVTTLVLTVRDLPTATYFLVVEGNDHRQVRSFIKK
jgi:hypothetical protein